MVLRFLPVLWTCCYSTTTVHKYKLHPTLALHPPTTYPGGLIVYKNAM